jgi:hypothetical protein
MARAATASSSDEERGAIRDFIFYSSSKRDAERVDPHYYILGCGPGVKYGI